MVNLIKKFTNVPVVKKWQMAKTTAGNLSFGFEIATGKRFVLQISRTGTVEGLHQQHYLQRRLTERGINTPVFLKLRNEEFVGEHHGRLFTISALIRGDRPTAYPRGLIHSFGRTLADVHAAWDGVNIKDMPTQWLSTSADECTIPASRLSGGIRTTCTSARNLARVLHNALVPRELLQANIHADLHPDNVFSRGQRITTVFDLETAQRAPRIYDLARTALTLHKRSQLPLTDVFGHVTKSYEQHSGSALTALEHQSTAVALAFVASQTASHILSNGNLESGTFYLRIASQLADRNLVSLAA